MLPAPADFVAQHIDRARFQVQDENLRALARRVGAKAHAAVASKGHAHDQLELRHVAMPAERRARPVLVDRQWGKSPGAASTSSETRFLSGSRKPGRGGAGPSS